MLLSLWFLVVLVVAAVVCAAIALALWRQLRVVPRTKELMAVQACSCVLAVALGALAGLDGVNRHFSYIPSVAALFGDVSRDLRPHAFAASAVAQAPPADERPPDHGVVEKVEVAGPQSGIGPRDTYVYLPPAYFDGRQPNRRFPVLYLIHGSPGTSVDWLRGGYVDRSMDELLSHNAIDPFIVVLPDVNGGYGRDVECQDVVGGPQAQTYLVHDVVSFVDNRYRTIADPTARAIGGLSTGGYCGINLTLRHQDVFSAAVSESGYGRPDNNRYTGDLFGGSRQLARQNTPDAYVPTIPLTRALGIYLDAGSADTEARTDSTRLYGMLKARGVDVTLNIVRGESHDFVAFRRDLRLALPWVSHWFAGELNASAEATVAAPDTSDLPPPSPSDVAGKQAVPRCTTTTTTRRRLVVSHLTANTACRRR